MYKNNKEKIRQHPKNILDVIVKNIYIYICTVLCMYNIHNMAVITLTYFKNILYIDILCFLPPFLSLKNITIFQDMSKPRRFFLLCG